MRASPGSTSWGATEDERFYRHHGIDVIGLLRAGPLRRRPLLVRAGREHDHRAGREPTLFRLDGARLNAGQATLLAGSSRSMPAGARGTIALVGSRVPQPRGLRGVVRLAATLVVVLGAVVVSDGVGEQPQRIALGGVQVSRAQPQPWLVIDPKLFVGELPYDATQHLLKLGTHRGGRSLACLFSSAPASGLHRRSI
jgi:hypothetical protein